MSKHTRRVTTSEPLVVRTIDGCVMVCVQPDEDAWIRFRTVAAYNAFREHLDREQVGHETAAILEFVAERDAYHRRVRELRTERIQLTDPEAS